jgi:hypothetical protein
MLTDRMVRTAQLVTVEMPTLDPTPELTTMSLETDIYEVRVVPRPPTPNMPTNGERARATGLRRPCDIKFVNEVLARYPRPSMPGGWMTDIELRHLDLEQVATLSVSPHLRIPPTGQPRSLPPSLLPVAARN